MAETLLTYKPLAVAILGGVTPALLWLWFWLREDRKSPEPTGLIAISFFAGMAVVYFVLPLQKLVVATLPSLMALLNSIASNLSLVAPSDDVVKITLWGIIEETAKYATVFFVAFKSRHFDEPLDAVIYLITAALGFSAMENILYIMSDMNHLSIVQTFLNGNMRFIGASLVHTVCSAFIGIAIAFSFYSGRFVKTTAVLAGVLIASLLHAYFNLSIIQTNGTLNILSIFFRFWVAIFIIIILLQIIKRLTRNN